MRKEKAFVLGILSGFVLMIPLRLWAQGKDIKFEHISLEQRLSQGSVYAILQDIDMHYTL